MIVQIYEVQSPEEGVALARRGVDHVGVLIGNGAFPRELPADRATAIFAALPPSAKRVALSLSADPAEVARVVEQTRPDIIHIGAAVELLSVGDTLALKPHFPTSGSCARSPSSMRRASNARRHTGRRPTSCCSTAMNPATGRSAGSAACMIGASA